MELPLFEGVRSTAADPRPEQARTHAAQMIIKHCGKRAKHVSHAFHDDFPFGCPGTPDLRDNATVVADARAATERVLAVQEMELRTYDCGVKLSHHEPHQRADGLPCPGLVTRRCDNPERHVHHRWWVVPDAFYWCDGLVDAVYTRQPGALVLTAPMFGRPIEDVELP